jgi:formate dehydrogenase subunit gamma
MIQRYSPEERANHWIVALFFILAALSGLALFHPSFFFFSNLFGGGAWTRILHPFIGLIMFFFFMFMAARYWGDNAVNDTDRRWMKQLRDVIANRDHGLPEAGKYNAGQKYLFWTLVVCMALLILSGIVMWRPYFVEFFPIWLNRIAVVVHALAAFVLIMGIIVHIYAAIWVKGSIRAMTRGTVTDAWAKHHHPGWYRQVSRK